MKLEDLNHYYSQFKYGEDVFHQLMTKRVREILLVATFYDAFIFEQDGRLSEQIYGEYRQLNLSTAPRITSVPTASEAIKKLETQSFDLVITMMRIGDMSPFSLAKSIKQKYQSLPVLLLLNVQSDFILWENHVEDKEYIDDVFLWNGDTKLFLAMVKSVEDKLNTPSDTKNGLVRLILLVEDSVHYYSLFLPTLYSIIMKQTQKLIEEELNDIYKRLRMRIRPKVLLAHDYDEALKIYEEYKEFILCVISDVRYKIKGQEDAEAGIKLITHILKKQKDMPIILQSSEQSNEAIAKSLKVHFLNKNSKQLFSELRAYMEYNLGFGDFIFRNPDGTIIDQSTNIQDFETKILSITDESLLFHSRNNHFSNWLIARGEIEIAKKIRPMQVEDFKSNAELRQMIFSTFQEVRIGKNRGKIINFDAVSLSQTNQIIRLTEGSLGGKGRGLAFLNALLCTMDYEKKFKGISISLPSTAIIGTNEFDQFIEKNHLIDKINDKNDEEINQLFLNAPLSKILCDRLKIYIEFIDYPIAVRSSSLLEDSQAQPLAGVYKTFMLPNNHTDKSQRVLQLMNAIKLVFASVYLSDTRFYLESLNFKAEEEKMAVIIQELVGSLHSDRHYYPHISGVAQSYNFYPTSYMDNADGISSIALGLGKWVVEGKESYRFCPKYPDNEMLAPDELIKNSQKEFYAIDLSIKDFDLSMGDEITLAKLTIKEAEKHKTIEYLASVWDYENERITDDPTVKGMKVMTFFSILKYNYFPLAQICSEILEMGEIALGIPVEIEYAVNLDKDERYGFNPSFYILQIRPLSISSETYHIDKEKLKKDDLLLLTEHGMGNGIVHDLYDIIYLDPKCFDKTKTLEMAEEIDLLNTKLKDLHRKYILIGPGRWGSRDRFLGIPVKWANINRSKVIIETGLSDFIVEASQGTHFFHNLVAMNVGYFTIPYYSEQDFIDWEWIYNQEIKERREFFVHIQFNHPLIVKMDGKTGLAIIQK